jgi:hypothetical protein
VVKRAYLADMRVFVVVLLWRKRGELHGKRGRKTARFVVLKNRTPCADLFFGADSMPIRDGKRQPQVLRLRCSRFWSGWRDGNNKSNDKGKNNGKGNDKCGDPSLRSG